MRGARRYVDFQVAGSEQKASGPDVLPIEEATRLQDLYVVSFFKWRMLNESGYDRYLTTEFANTEPGVTISVR